MVQVGVSTNDGGGFATQLQRGGHQLFSGQALNAHAHIRATCEGNALDERVLDDGVTYDRALARQHADDAVRHASLLRNVRQFNRHAGCDLGGFEYHRAACGQGGGQLLGLAGDGGVPRRDGTDHAQGFVHTHGQEVATRRRHLVFPGFAGCGKKLKRTRRAGNQGTGFLDGLAIVQALQLGKLFAAFTDACGNAVQDACALVALQPRPVGAVTRHFGGLNSFVHVGGSGCMQAGHGAAIVGVLGGVLGARGMAPLASDQGFNGCSHGDSRRF